MTCRAIRPGFLRISTKRTPEFSSSLQSGTTENPRPRWALRGECTVLGLGTTLARGGVQGIGYSGTASYPSHGPISSSRSYLHCSETIEGIAMTQNTGETRFVRIGGRRRGRHRALPPARADDRPRKERGADDVGRRGRIAAVAPLIVPSRPEAAPEFRPCRTSGLHDDPRGLQDLQRIADTGDAG